MSEHLSDSSYNHKQEALDELTAYFYPIAVNMCNQNTVMAEAALFKVIDKYDKKFEAYNRKADNIHYYLRKCLSREVNALTKKRTRIYRKEREVDFEGWHERIIGSIGDNVSDVMDAKKLVAEIFNYVQCKMKEVYQIIFWLSFVEDLSHEEIFEHLQRENIDIKSVRQVTTNIYRIRQKIRKRFRT